MLRGLMWFVLLVGGAFIIAPFFLSSLATDERGVTIPGTVYSKNESVGVRYSDWTRSEEVTIEYEPPDRAGVLYWKMSPGLAAYDALHMGDKVKLHYLRRADVPDVPGAGVLHDLHALPMVRLAHQRTFSNVQRAFSGVAGSIAGVIAGIIAMLIVLHRTGSPLFKWALGISVACGLTALLVYDFPRPTPAPQASVRQATGTVQNLDRITKLFSANRSRGTLAEQPVDVVGVAFVPAGTTQPVLAVDLIDSGSLANLKENSTVQIRYEADHPRTAHIVGAKRSFVSKNIVGLILDGVLAVSVLAGLLFGAQWLGRAFNRLVASRAGSRNQG